MNRRMARGACVGAVACLSVFAGAGPVLAHGKGAGNVHDQSAPVLGLVTAVSSTSLEIQMQNGSVSIPLAPTTRVTRMVSGSLADLAPGEIVGLHLIRGTTTVDSIRIALVEKPHAIPTGPHANHTTPGRRRPKVAWNSHVSGQVVAATDSTITLRVGHGQTTTYALAANVTVTKVMAGHLSDLAVGETVQVFREHPDGAAVAIVILNG